jgi:hypothetical protein
LIGSAGPLKAAAVMGADPGIEGSAGPTIDLPKGTYTHPPVKYPGEEGSQPLGAKSPGPARCPWFGSSAVRRRRPPIKRDFTFIGVKADYECAVDDSPFTSCTSGQNLGPRGPGDHLFQVRETLAGIIGPVASYRWTVDPARNLRSTCRRGLRLRLHGKHKARLVIHCFCFGFVSVRVVGIVC